MSEIKPINNTRGQVLQMVSCIGPSLLARSSEAGIGLHTSFIHLTSTLCAQISCILDLSITVQYLDPPGMAQYL